MHFNAVDLAINDHYLYMSVRYKGGIISECLPRGGIVIYDISSPVPVVVDGNNILHCGYTEKISSDGKKAIMNCGQLGFNIYDVSNKSDIIEKSHVIVPARANVLKAQQVGSIDILAHAGNDGGAWVL